MRHSAALLAVLAIPLLAPAAPAGAQPPPDSVATAPRDTTAGLFSRHGWAEAGIGWMSGPAWLRRRFAAGQGVAAGLEAEPRRWLRLRGGADYQSLIATARAGYETGLVKGPDEEPDSLAFDVESRSWSVALRAEAGARVPGGVWLWAGGGPAWFDGGMDASVARVTDEVVLRVREAARDGWGWTATLGAARSLEPFLPWPVGLDLHWRTLRRHDGRIEQWAIRLVWMRP